MTTTSALSEAAQRLVQLSTALADALRAGDLDAAERLVVERGSLLDLLAVAPPPPAADAAAALGLLTEADTATVSVAAAGVDGLRAAMAELATGARAAHGYLATAPLAPGYVDARD